MIEIYREDKQTSELKTPKIRIGKDEIYFVDDKGDNIATVIFFKFKELSKNCKTALEEEGYRTDFAKWDDKGRLIGFIEDVI